MLRLVEDPLGVKNVLVKIINHHIPLKNIILTTEI